MASSKLMSSSSKSQNSDLSQRPSSFSSATKPKPTTTTPHLSSSSAHPQTLSNYQNIVVNTTPLIPIGSMTVDDLLYDSNPTLMTSVTHLDTQMTILDVAAEVNGSSALPAKTVDEVRREIVSGEGRYKCKVEVPDEMMTLEEFLVRTGAVEENDIKDFPLAPPPEMKRLSSGLLNIHHHVRLVFWAPVAEKQGISREVECDS